MDFREAFAVGTGMAPQASMQSNYPPEAARCLSATALPDGAESYIGAFGGKDNRLEQWTVLGPESVYDFRERSEHEN